MNGGVPTARLSNNRRFFLQSACADGTYQKTSIIRQLKRIEYCRRAATALQHKYFAF